MTRSQSIHLDLLRGMAALTVFASHAVVLLGVPGALRPDAGHDAVIVFFVLSGFVIAHVAANRERDWRDFAVSRIARIYSVAVPALLLTLAIDLFLTGHGETTWSRGYQLAQPWKYLPFFLLFLTDIWFLGETAFSNLPFWSLCYEVWYYAAFAAATWLTGRWRLAALLAIAAVVGPRLWLLFPIWLLGVAVCRGQALRPLSPLHARLLLVASGALIVVWLAAGATAALDAWIDRATMGWVNAHLRQSRYFLGDWLLGLIVAVHVWAARDAAIDYGRLARPIALVAGASFTLYAAHYPLLGFWRHLLPGWPLAVVAAALGSVLLLSLVTERRKPALQRWLRRRLGRAPLSPLPAAAGER
jgi:peptidoglycan/LPS O-acetylase OafA/YrhL